MTEIVDLELFDGWTGWQRRIAATGGLDLRVWSSVQLHELDEAVESGRRTGEGGELLGTGPLKLFADGALGSRTAWCDHDYEGGEPNDRGRRLLDGDELQALIVRAHGAGISTTIHAIGDAANRSALDAFARAGVRGRIEHAQLLATEDLRRFAQLDVVASVQPAHAPEDRDLADRYWAGRTDRSYAYASLLRAGARLVLGSDAPVSPLDPWRAIACAVNRTDDDRPPWHPEQALTLEEALAASSSGRLTVGERADLIVCAEDPFALPLSDLAATPVWATMVAGVWTHQSW